MSCIHQLTSQLTEQIALQRQKEIVALKDISLHIDRDIGRSKQCVEVLQNIHLTFSVGDFVCLLGRPGCGKTSLLRVIAGHQKPTFGTVNVAGQPHSQNAIEIIAQRPNLSPWLSIADTVDRSLKRYQSSASQRQKLVNHYLYLVGLLRVSHLRPHKLSAEMRQRAVIARTLAANPGVVLMDNPFGRFDVPTREALQIHLKQVWQRTRKTILFVTDDVEEALILSSRIIVMRPNPGQIVEDMLNPFRHVSTHLSPAYLANLRVQPELIRLSQRLNTSMYSDSHIV